MEVRPSSSSPLVSKGGGRKASAAGAVASKREEGARPGSYLSRSQDNLGGVDGRKLTAAVTVRGAALRPQSGSAMQKVSSAVGLSGRSQTSPLSPVKDAGLRVAGRPAARRAAVSQQADARINKTKTTVTELQKAKRDLEAQLSELTKKADLKQAEIANLRMELRNAAEAHDEQMEQCRQEVEELRLRLSGSAACGDVVASVVLRRDASTSADSCGADDVMSADEAAALQEWDRQSCSSQFSEVSLACLQDRIVQMEETHHSTTEELQATLQELTDLQDIVDDLSSENQQLSEDKQALVDSLCSQARKMDHARLQIDNLKHLLMTSPDLCRGGRLTDEQQLRLVDAMRATHDDNEDLRGRLAQQRQATDAMQTQVDEQKDVAAVLRSQTRLIEARADQLSEQVAALQDQLLSAERDTDKERKELQRLSCLFENEKCRTSELQRQIAVAGGTDEHQLVDALRRQKDAAEQRCCDLSLAVASHKQQLDERDYDKARVAGELESTRHVATELASRVTSLESQLTETSAALAEARAAATQLEERVVRQCEDRNEYKANISSLQMRIEELAADRSRLQQQVAESRRQREGEIAEWKQFQADLQVAVVVANDFKVEAQTDIERLTDENLALRNRLAALSAEADRLRARRLSPPSTARSTSDAPVRARGVAGSQQARAISVKALIDALETDPVAHKPPLPPTTGDADAAARRDATATLPRPSVAAGNKDAKATISASSSELSARRHRGRDAAAAQLNNFTRSDVALAAAAGSTRRTDEESPANGVAPPKGILATRKSASTLNTATQRRAAYLDPETNDPLARLMKDAPRGSRRNALLKWCQARLVSYANVEVTNFSTSWNDGLAFCALIHSYLPQKVPFAALGQCDKRRNFTLAFGVAEAAGVGAMLSADEMVGLERPDWQAVMNYVVAVYKHFEG